MSEDKAIRAAIVGSREFPKLQWVDQLVDRLPAGSTVVSGHARGVDRRAELRAEQLIKQGKDLKLKVHRAMWHGPDGKGAYNKGAGFARNKDILNDAEVVFCFWDLQSKGARHDIELALKWDLKLVVISPEGLIHDTYQGTVESTLWQLGLGPLPADQEVVEAFFAQGKVAGS